MEFIKQILLLKNTPEQVDYLLANGSVSKNNNQFGYEYQNSSSYQLDAYNKANLSKFLFEGKKASAQIIYNLKPETKQAFSNQITAYIKTISHGMERYDNVFLARVMSMHPAIDDSAFAWYCLNYPCDFGKNVIQKVLGRYTDVLFSKGSYIIESSNKKGQDVLDKNLFQSLNFVSFCKDILPTLTVGDANAWIGVVRNSDEDNDVSLVYFAAHEFINRYDNIDFFKKNNIWYAFGSDYTYFLDEKNLYYYSDNSTKYNDIIRYKSAAKQVRRIGGVAENCEYAPDKIIYNSFFAKGEDAILDYIQAHLEAKYYAKETTHPIKEELVETCVDCNGSGSQYEYDELTNVQCAVKCKTCKGTKRANIGIMHGGKITRNAEVILDNAKGMPAVSWHERNANTLADDREERKKTAVYKAYAVEGIFTAQSGTAKQEDGRELQGNISAFGNLLFGLISFIGETFLKVATNSDEIVKSLKVVNPNPATYDLQSYDKKLQTYTTLASSSATNLLLQNELSDAIIQSSSDEITIKKSKLLAMFKPFNGERPDVVQSKLAQNLCTKEDAILYHNAENLVQKLYIQNMTNFEYMENKVLFAELVKMGDALILEVQAQNPTDAIAEALNALSE